MPLFQLIRFRVSLNRVENTPDLLLQHHQIERFFTIPFGRSPPIPFRQLPYTSIVLICTNAKQNRPVKVKGGEGLLCPVSKVLSQPERGGTLKIVLLLLLTTLTGCHLGKSATGPKITFTRVPQATTGAAEKLDVIQGRVDGAKPGQQIVLYVKRNNWWLQPLANAPFTKIQQDSTWINSIHVGPEYAAVLVDQGYTPQAEIEDLPKPGNLVHAVSTSKDFPSAAVVSPTLSFGGYEWRIRNVPSSRGDRPNPYSPANAWTDSDGALHLRIAQEGGKWSCAEVTLTRSFGYGNYSFRVRDTSNLAANITFSMFTYDYVGAEQNNREMGIEIGQTSDPSIKNSQYVIQPFYVASNVARFSAPTGPVIHSFHWEPGKISFKTVGVKSETKPFAEHEFSSGVPSPGQETVRMALYIFGHDDPNQKGAEVIIEKFEYLP